MKRLQARCYIFAFGVQQIRRWRAIARHCHRCLNNRLVAGAAAKVPLQGCLDLLRRWFGRLHPERIERHDESGRAKATLAPVVFNHRFLDRMQPTFRAGEMLDRDHMTTVDGCQKPNAGIDRFIHQPGIAKPSHEHGAGAAIAFGAAFL